MSSSYHFSQISFRTLGKFFWLHNFFFHPPDYSVAAQVREWEHKNKIITWKHFALITLLNLNYDRSSHKFKTEVWMIYLNWYPRRFYLHIHFLSCRFLELPSKVSTSLETLMDHIGVLYKFHDRPITYLYNTLHYFEHRIRERHTLKKTLVSSIVGSLKDVRPAGWCLTADYQGLLERSPKDNEEWKPGPDYYVRLVGRLVRSLQVSWIPFSESVAWNQN